MLIIWVPMSDSLGFLISDVSRLMRRRFDERARLIGVTRAQWRTLTTLARHEGLNQGSLADLLEVEPITLCRMIDRLEEAGLVERRRDPADRRAWRIHLKPAAAPMLVKLEEMGSAFNADMLAGISAADRETVLRVLGQMRGNLDQGEQ